MIYLNLFLSFFQIGAFSFGGGYAALPLIQTQVVTKQHWLSMGEFTNLITISQMTPGPIAINAATFVGNRVGGILGALAATLGCIMPSCLLVSFLAYVYIKYKNIEILQKILAVLRPAVVALIASSGVMILINAFWGEDLPVTVKTTRWHQICWFLLALYFLKKKNADPVLVMLLAGILNLVFAIAIKWV